jgi:hypothetical protein
MGIAIIIIRKKEYLALLQTNEKCLGKFPAEYDFVICGFNDTWKPPLSELIALKTLLVMPNAALTMLPKK